jgi:hypothetical protein
MITKPVRRKLVKPRKPPTVPKESQTALAESAARKMPQGQGRQSQNMPLTQVPMGAEL